MLCSVVSDLDLHSLLKCGILSRFTLFAEACLSEYYRVNMVFLRCILKLIRVPRLTETKPKYRNETEIPKRTIKNIGKESNLHLYHWFLVSFWYS